MISDGHFGDKRGPVTCIYQAEGRAEYSINETAADQRDNVRDVIGRLDHDVTVAASTAVRPCAGEDARQCGPTFRA